MCKKNVPAAPGTPLTDAAAPILPELQTLSALNNSCAQDTRPTWSRIRRIYSKPGILRPDPRPSAGSAIGAVYGSFRHRATVLQKVRGWLSFGQCTKRTGVRVVCTKEVISSAKLIAGIILMARSLNRGCSRRQNSAEMPPAPVAAAGNIKNAVS